MAYKFLPAHFFLAIIMALKCEINVIGKNNNFCLPTYLKSSYDVGLVVEFQVQNTKHLAAVSFFNLLKWNDGDAKYKLKAYYLQVKAFSNLTYMYKTCIFSEKLCMSKISYQNMVLANPC